MAVSAALLGFNNLRGNYIKMTETEKTKSTYLSGIAIGSFGDCSYASLSLLLNSINKKAILLEAKLNMIELSKEAINDISLSANIDYYLGVIAAFTAGVGFYHLIHKK